MVNGLFKIRKFYKVHNNKLVYICVPNEFVIGQVVLKSYIKRVAVDMVNKTVRCFNCMEPYAHTLTFL
jgi:hypothetical protein